MSPASAQMWVLYGTVENIHHRLLHTESQQQRFNSTASEGQIAAQAGAIIMKTTDGQQI